MRAVLLASVALVLAPRAALAEPARTSSLSWVRLAGAEGCLGAADLARAVEERLGRDVFVSASRGDLVVEGRAERTSAPAGWRATLQLADSGGRILGDRTVESRATGCEELGRLVVVAIAVMLDPVTTPPAPPPEPQVRPRVVERPAQPRVVVRRVVVTRPAPRWRIEAEGSLAGAVGLLPGAAAGVLGALVLVPPRFVPIVLEGAVFPLAERRSGLDLLEAHGGVQLCPLWWRRARFGLDACAGVDGGAVVVIDGGDGERLLVQARVSVRGQWRLVGPLVLRATLQGVVPLRADDFAATDDAGDRVCLDMPPVGAVFALGLGLSFGGGGS